MTTITDQIFVSSIFTFNRPVEFHEISSHEGLWVNRIPWVSRGLGIRVVVPRWYACATFPSALARILHQSAWFDELQAEAMVFGPVGQRQSNERGAWIE